ncbi:MupG family TIM beta-alpha barrel fold protein [Mammaliicoccus stepanovicii]|uniref:Outer surface protein n=1 Tax=Mammaliicoccus stepanovicii TaxID=643214 RepID=A0A239YFJ3_9STAP|nr:MupG family TIM beta-alpha barrel fold protein [Mammaliicoccus stepanovicii]PNZ75820.1 DUF871 domain-containing protein [Mammaliicoccus stepanovicii]GGI42691.1 hypothetical protein GCM10010896_19680 [Mammaliicoccus stepanovicii]SNV57008.1 outer surface protein [Mammaliicoccus stepanovicii]
MLGFSVFLGDSFDEKYIETMLSEGFKYVFTSLQMPEDDPRIYLSKLKELVSIIDGRAEIIADVNPSTFENLGLSYKEPKKLREIGIDLIRLDISLNPEDIALLLTDMKVVCNASTDAIALLKALRVQNTNLQNVMVAHNYYPRPETGLDEEFFVKQNENIKNEFPEVSIMAFVPGTSMRGPVFKGLPTLENHRAVHPLKATYDLLKLGVDDVCIGDSSIDQETIFQFNTYFHDGIVSLHVEHVSEHLDKMLGTVFHNRQDQARDVIRAEEARKHNHDEVEPYNVIDRNKGSITVDNSLYGRYMNELQITKVALPSNEAVNVIGYVKDRDKDCIDMIEAGCAFQFIKGED